MLFLLFLLFQRSMNYNAIKLAFFEVIFIVVGLVGISVCLVVELCVHPNALNRYI